MINSHIAMIKILEGLYAGGIVSKKDFDFLSPLFKKQYYQTCIDYVASNKKNMSNNSYSSLFFILNSAHLFNFSL